MVHLDLHIIVLYFGDMDALTKIGLKFGDPSLNLEPLMSMVEVKIESVTDII